MVRLSELINIKSTQLANTYFLTISDFNPYDKNNNDLDSVHSAVFSSNEEESSRQNDSEKNIDDYVSINPNAVLTVINNKSQEISYRFSKVIELGSYGQVLEYKQKNNHGNNANTLPPSLCVKISLRANDLENDIKILQTLPANFQSSGLIDTVCLDIVVDHIRGQEPILIMPKMRGSVMDLFRKLEFSNLVEKTLIVNNVLYTISKTLLQLLEVGIYYTDLKLNNCLYQMGPNKAIQVYLCDLGSAFLKDQNDAMATYPHTYRIDCHDFVPELFDLQYGLMIIYFQMMIENVNDPNDKFSIRPNEFFKLFHKEIKNLKLEKKKSIVNDIFKLLYELILNVERDGQTQKKLTNYVKQLENHLTTRHKTGLNEVEKLQEITLFFREGGHILKLKA